MIYSMIFPPFALSTHTLLHRRHRRRLAEVHGGRAGHVHDHAVVLLVQRDEAGEPRRRLRVLLVPRARNALGFVGGAVGQEVLVLLGDLHVAQEAGDALAEGRLRPVLRVLRLDRPAPAPAGTLDVDLGWW